MVRDKADFSGDFLIILFLNPHVQSNSLYFSVLCVVRWKLKKLRWDLSDTGLSTKEFNDDINWNFTGNRFNWSAVHKIRTVQSFWSLTLCGLPCTWSKLYSWRVLLTVIQPCITNLIQSVGLPKPNCWAMNYIHDVVFTMQWVTNLTWRCQVQVIYSLQGGSEKSLNISMIFY